MLTVTWFNLNFITRNTNNISELLWMNNLARISQASMVGYMTCGLVTNMAYFDFVFLIMVIAAKLRIMVENMQKTEKSKKASSSISANEELNSI